VHAALPILLSASIVLTAALLLPLGIMIGRRMPPPVPAEGGLLPNPAPLPPYPARNRPVVIYATCVGVRAPPTFPAQRGVLRPGFLLSRE